MKLKESSHLLAEVLYADGIDIYKRSTDDLRELKPTIVNTRLRIDAVLHEHFCTSFHELDNLPPKELQRIRESFLGFYRGSVEKAEKLKKWIPLNQLVGYTEVLVASAYLQLNTEIDADIEKVDTKDSVKTIHIEHLRIKILNAFKKINQGKKWEEVRQEIESYLKDACIEPIGGLFEKWRTTFEAINHPLQELYAEYAETMQINDAIYDLQYREQKRSAVIQNLVGEARRNWKPADLEHDIHAQSAEANRSVIELVCNAIDANTETENIVNLSINKNGYSVRDHGDGMNPYVILEKLMIPKVSGKTGESTIGRFGIGFYTALSHLKRDNDIVKVETRDGQTGHIIEFKIHERTGDVFVHTERNDKLTEGTNITVQLEDFDSKDAEKLCRDHLAHNDRSNIILNGEKINKTEGFKSIKDKTVKIKYATEVSDQAKVSIMVNGVIIETSNVKGVNLCKEVALDFPLSCSLPESRSELAVDSAALASAKKIINLIFTGEINDETKIAVSNALYPALEKLQTRSRSSKRDDNLPVYLQEAFKSSVAMENKTFLPNAKAFQALNVPNATYLDSRIYATALERIPGITKCNRFESAEGYLLFIADFKENTDEFVVEDGKRLVINRKVYERHKDNPAALNAYLSSLDNTYQNKKEKSKGRIVTSSNITDDVKRQSHEKIELDERLEAIFEILDLKEEKRDHEDFARFAALSEQDQIKAVKLKYIESCCEILDHFNTNIEYYEYARYLRPITKELKPITTSDKERIMNEIRRRIIQCDNMPLREISDELTDLLKDELGTHRDDCEVNPKEFCFFNGLQFFKKHGGVNLISLMDEAAAWRCEINASRGRSVHGLYSEKWDFRNDLTTLNAFFPLKEMERFFSKYDKEYLFAYHHFMQYFLVDDRGLPFLCDDKNLALSKKMSIEMITRADEIFRKKLINKPVEDILDISDARAFIDFSKIQYHDIPRSARGYWMYIIEGGEILSEKDFDENNTEQAEYQTQIPLSLLVQAKKDNENYFQEFSGTSAELAAYARESQRGVDPSKAMRDIMHAAENQIVNDGYLWIREVLQNSLDAVKQNKEQFAETPKVSVDTYLRKKVKDIPEDQLWTVLQSAITRYYPDHFLFFKRNIASSVPKLTSETFASAIDVLGKMTDGSQNYFPKSFINELAAQFEAIAEIDLVVEARDPVGMDLHTIINYLLIPNESSKKYDEETIGKFGQGFFTIFGDAKEVLIKTSKGDFRTEYVKIKPIKDQSGKIVDFSVEMSFKAEEFKGTVIQKVVDTDMPQVEAAFCKSAVVSYGGLLDRKAVKLDFRDQEVNTPRTVLAEAKIPKLGAMKIYDAHENAMTQNGLFIKELDEELLEMIPEHLKKVMQKNGIVVDIPASIKLIKSRSDIARKKEVMPLLAEYFPALALKAYLSSVMLGKEEIPNIPYDYFESRRNRRVEKDIKSDAEKIASGESLINYKRYLQDENALIQLLTLLPCINVEGRQISINALAEKISEDQSSIDIDTLPESIQDKIKYETSRKFQETQDRKKAEQEYGVKGTMVIQDTDLPDKPELRNIASVYYAYNQLVKFIFECADAADVRPAYYLQIGQSSAHAYQGTNSIGFNLDYLEKQLPQLAEIIDQKLPVSDEKVQRFLEETISICTHERQHNLEGSEETQWTHNDIFFKGQREVIAKFIKNQSVNIQKALDEIYQKFTPSFISAKQLVEQMR